MYWLLMLTLAFDLAAVKSELNLEKRSDRALENAETVLSDVHDLYAAGDLAKTEAALTEVGESVDLAWTSLMESGKDARRSSSFKRAELKTRVLLRHLEGVRESLSIADRPLVDRVRDRVSEVHDMLLQRIMNRKH